MKAGKEEEKVEAKQHAELKGSTKKEGKEEGSKKAMIQYLLVALVMLAIIILAYFFFSNFLITPFSTFISNFNGAPRVAVLMNYSNESQFLSEVQCSTLIIESIAHTRNATTIDFFILNSTNCTYPSSGLGRPTQLKVAGRKACLQVARSEPSISLNYSSSNYTIITPYHLYVYGNYAYMEKCPIAAELT